MIPDWVLTYVLFTRLTDMVDLLFCTVEKSSRDLPKEPPFACPTFACLLSVACQIRFIESIPHPFLSEPICTVKMVHPFTLEIIYSAFGTAYDDRDHGSLSNKSHSLNTGFFRIVDKHKRENPLNRESTHINSEYVTKGKKHKTDEC